MPEKPSENRPYSFFPFWGSAIKEGWEKSREKFGLTVDIILLISGFILFLMAWYSKHHPKFDADKENAIMSYWFALIPALLWLFWFGWHVLKVPHEIYLEIHGKLKKEIERNDPKFKIFCDKDTEQGARFTPNKSFSFFRIRVETDCVNGIKNCLGHLCKIEKNGVVVFDHESLQLPFAKSEESDSLTKTIFQNVAKWLDILMIVTPPQDTPAKCRNTAI
jgi:hypothetical protein